MKKIILILMSAAMIVVAGCTSKGDPYVGQSFRDVCAQTSGMWMKMQPTQNYASTGQPACFGCMQPNGDHICEQEKYLQTLNTK